MKYKAILVDPPWDFKVWSKATGSGRSPSDHYPTMTLADICALPVGDLADTDCALFLWAVWPRIFDAQKVIEAWGFTFKTLAFDWVKVRKPAQLHFGMGYWSRANSEPCLLATRGKPKRRDAGVAQMIWEWQDYEPEALIARIGRHSAKPDEQYARIERLVAGSYVEVFARRTRPGWTSLGNEIDGLDISRAIALQAALPTPI